MKSTLYLFILFISIISCKTESDIVEEIPLTKDQQQKLDMTATSMIDAIASDRPQVVMDQFDHKSFSKRLGKNFYQMKAQEQSVVMGILINSLGQSISALTHDIANQELTVRLLDVRQDGPVSVLTLDVVDLLKDQVLNYLVLYLKENSKGEFVLVNFYNVFEGKSFGQLAKNFLEYDWQSDRIIRHFQDSRGNVDSALYYEHVGDYDKAYEQMNTIGDVFRNFGQYPIYRTNLAAQVSDSIFHKELRELENITPNEQSKKFYQCLLLTDSTQVEKKNACWEDFQELLLERELD